MSLRQLTRVTLVCLAPVAANAASQDFTVINRTGYQIDSIYLAESGHSGWENDVMGRDFLRPGERADISFARDTQRCRWDIKVKYHDETQAIWNDIDVCEISRLALFWDPVTRVTVARAE